MPDLLDAAEQAEHRQRQEALDRTLAKAQEPLQLRIDGQICCLDCEAPIAANRLAAKPDAPRCIPCQQRKELQDKIHG